MDEKNIRNLIDEARAAIKPEDVYNLTASKLDIPKMVRDSKEKPLSVHELGLSFAYVGFMQGIEYALRNIEPVEENGGSHND